jgi:hypothetical protein
MRRKTWTRPRSIKVFEIDIYQLFVQMRQATTRQMFWHFFSHLGLEKLQWTHKLIKLTGFALSQMH